jgi:hypothetical protein
LEEGIRLPPISMESLNLNKILIVLGSSTLCLSSALASDEIQGSVASEASIPHKRVGPQRNLTVDEMIGGWYFCAREEIAKQWLKQAPKVPSEYHCSCNFFIDSDGKLSDLKLLSSSGPSEIDKSLLDAMQQAFPLKQNASNLVHNKKFKMDFDESEHPKFHFKIIN